jgi:diguanylate cyclase (GGDEF)-like protein
VAVLLVLLLRERRLSVIDDLTGAPNRRGTRQIAQRLLADGNRQRDIIAVLDIDHFKKVNDAWGHSVGDVVLKEFYRLCKEQLRSTDLLGRWGGEEFLLFMPRVDVSQAEVVFKRLQSAVGEIRLAGDPAWRLTFSMGVTSVRGDVDLDALIEEADQALYVAKNSGRDTFIVSDHD